MGPHHPRTRVGRRAGALVILLLAEALGFSCASPRSPVAYKPTPLEEGIPGQPAYYDLDVQRVFDRSCGPGCHQTTATGGPQIGARETGLVLTSDRSYDALLDPGGSKNGPLVIPSRPDDSLLYWKIAFDPPNSEKRPGRRMPAALFGGRLVDGIPLSSQEIGLIRDWIQAGARRTTVPALPPLVSALALDRTTVEVTVVSDASSGAGDLARRYEIVGGGKGLSVFSAAMIGPKGVRLVTAAQQPGLSYTVSAFGAPGPPVSFRFTPAVLQIVKAVPVDSSALDLTFTEAVDPVTGAQPERYTIVGLTVHSAQVRQPDAVRLRTSPQNPGMVYTVVVAGVESLRGGTILPGEGDRASFTYVRPVAFTRDIQPIFTGTCALAGCHGGPTATFGLRLDSGFALGNLLGVASVTKPSVQRVKPGDPDNSLLVQKLEGAPGVGSRMPLGSSLRPSEILTIRQWISAGAPSN